MNTLPSNNQFAKLQVKRLLLREVLEQHSQISRPYASNYTSQERMKFDEVTQGGALIDESSLAGIANAILRPVARGVAEANIVGGWNNRRFYFFMEMDIARSKNSVNTEIVSGYTDYIGANMNTGTVDPNMRFYINNHLVINQVLAATGTGTGWVPMASSNNQVIVPPMMHGMSTQRPTDLFTGPLVESSVTELLQSHGAMVRPTVIGGEQIKLSRRANLTPASFLSSTLQAQRQARFTGDFLGDGEESAVLANAARRVGESDAASSTIIRNLINESNFLSSGFFTYGQLLSMDSTGTLDSRVNVVFNKEETQWDAFSVQNTQHWKGGDNTTLLANKLSTQLTKLALDNFSYGVEFAATNQTPTGQVQVVLTNMSLFSPELPFQMYHDRVVAGLEHMIMAECLMLPGASINIKASVNPMGTTRMFVSLDNEPEVPYSFPVFSDAMVSQVVNPSMEGVMALSKDLRDLSSMTDHTFQSNYTQVLPNQMKTVMGTPAVSQMPDWSLRAKGNLHTQKPNTPSKLSF